MTIVGLIIAIVVVALVYWLITVIPIDEKFKKVLMALLILVVIVWLLITFLPGLANYRIGN